MTHDPDVLPTRRKSIEEGARVFQQAIDAASKTTAGERRERLDQRCDQYRQRRPTCGSGSAG